MAAPAEPAQARTWGIEALTTLVVVAASVAFTVSQLEPGLLLTATTPAGGDMGAHVWGPAYLRDTLLPDGRLTGWAPDWYAGFPAYHFYMVVPSLLIVALDVVMPYGVAFKLVSVLGVATLPVAAWGLGRLARLPFPGPPLLAVAAVGFLFDRSFSIYGGNIASTLAGEFAFSISLSLAVVYVGLVLAGLRDGRHRPIAAIVLALTALCHVIPAIMAVAATGVALLSRLDRPRLRWALTTGVVGCALTGFWTVPFVLRRAYLNDMGWEKQTRFLEGLFPGGVGEGLSRALGGAADGAVPGDLTVVAALAVVGAGVAIFTRRPLPTFLVLLGGLAAFGYVVAPQGRLWNARLLPFWYLCLYLLAAVAVAQGITVLSQLAGRRGEGIRVVSEHVARRGEGIRVLSQLAGRREVRTRAVLGAGVALVALAAVALPLRALPLGHERVDGTYAWGPVTTTDVSYVPGWARWNYSGYERKDAYPEYRALIDTMAAVGSSEGCGRAMWEYHPDLDTYGTPMAPMLLPYWTDGCIDSMEGLFFEASATTPYHFVNQSELSNEPSRAQRDIPYGPLDVTMGVDHLQMLGVRYYLAYTEEAAAQAEVEPDLTLVETTGPWRIYEVANAELVAPLDAVPAVLTGIPEGGEPWLDASVGWYTDPEAWSTPLAADGPPAWERVGVGERPVERPTPPTTVTSITEGDDWLSFSVDRVGSPVVVKTSYFPNWQARGADGPYRITPNLMVVVPTEADVRLDYRDTPVEWWGWALTAAGAVGLVLLARAGPVATVPARSRREGEVEAVAPAPAPVAPAPVAPDPSTSTARATPPGELRMTVVIPAYDEAGRIGPAVTAVGAALGEVADAGGLEVVVVDDGSSDGTAAEAEAAGARVVRLPANRGKGAAVRAGILAGRGRCVAFVDADLAYPPTLLLELLAAVEAGSDVAVGSRVHPGSSSVATPRLRRVAGRVFNVLTATVLLGHHRDTQCGLKAFRSDAARRIFTRTRVDGFAFDVEVLHLVERDGLSLAELPVSVVATSGSTVTVALDALRMVRDLFRVRRWAARGCYDG